MYFCTHQHNLKIPFVCRGVLYKCLYKEILSPLLETKSKLSTEWKTTLLMMVVVNQGEIRSREGEIPGLALLFGGFPPPAAFPFSAKSWKI